MSQSQKTLFGATLSAQVLHLLFFTLLWTRVIAPITVQLSAIIFFLVALNLVIAVRISRLCPWAEPIATAYSMACALRLLAFTCGVLLPLLHMRNIPNNFGPIPIPVATAFLMHGLGAAALVRIQRSYAPSR